MHHETLERFEALLELHGKTPKTIRSYRSTIAQYLQSLDGKEPSFQTVQDFLLSKKRAGGKDSSIARHLAALRLYFTLLGRKDELAPLKSPTIILKEIEYLTKEEVLIFLNNAPTIKYRAIFELMYGCALRVDEAAQARIEDVEGMTFDSEQRRWIVSTRTHGMFKIPAEHAKSRKVDHVPLDVRIIETLCAYLNTRTDNSPWLFLGRGDTHMSESTIRGKIPKFCEECGITRISSQGLRHSRITHLILANYPPAKVQKFARHRSYSTTQRYIHIRPKEDLADLPLIF